MRSHLKSFAGRNAVAFVALFVALGGTATAASQFIDGKKIKKNTITSKQVKNGSLKAADFKSGQLPRGSAGTPGAAGAPGSSGTAGPAGSPGTTGLTMKAYSLPDAVRAPAAATTQDPSDSDFHAIGSVAGYSFAMACRDQLPFANDQSGTTTHYDNYMLVRIAGNSLEDPTAGWGEANSRTYDYGTPTTYTYQDDTSGQWADTFSVGTGVVVRVTARIVVDSDSCEYRNVKLYVWS